MTEPLPELRQREVPVGMGPRPATEHVGGDKRDKGEGKGGKGGKSGGKGKGK